jgi:predicted RNA methylase
VAHHGRKEWIILGEKSGSSWVKTVVHHRARLDKERIYGALRESLTRKYGRLADLVTAAFFGVQVDVGLEQWNALADYATGRSPIAAMPIFKQWLDAAEAVARERRFFHWELEFPEVFFDKHGKPLEDKAGFDAVVGNPPWGATIDMEQKAFLTSAFATKKGEVEIYLYMIEQAGKLLASNGRLGFITPNTWLTQKRGQDVRKLIRADYSVISVLHLRKNIFKAAPDIVPIVVILKANPQHGEVTIMVANPEVQPPDDIINGNYWKQYTVSTAVWDSHPLTNFNIFRSTLVHELCIKVEKCSEFLSKHYRAIYGIRTGENERYLLDNPEPSALPCLVNASEIRRYVIHWSGKYLKADDLLTNTKISELKQPKILVQYSRKLSMPVRIMAACDTDGEYAPLNRFSFLIAEHPEQKHLLLYLMAVESSSILNFYHANTFIDYDIKPTYLQTHPIRRINFTTPEPHRQEMAEKGSALYERGLNEQSHGEILGFVRLSLSQEPEEADVVHDLLAYLAQQMIELNKQRQLDVEDFVLDLEGVLSPADLQKIGRLWTPPSNTEPPADAMAQLGPLVSKRLELRDDIGKVTEDQWKWLLRGRLKKIASLADLVRVYRQRQPAIAALDQRIAFTDSLIDLIVYQLYGLTEDEVAIVEGKDDVDQ